MAHGIFNQKRDFQVAEIMAWHNLTKLETPTREHFPEITPRRIFYDDGQTSQEVSFGDKSYSIPVSTDDGLPVAPPYAPGTYTLFTPREAWDWTTEILSGTGYTVESIGMLWNRSFWFISTKLTELQSLKTGDGRDTNFQLNFSGGLDRKVSPQAELSAIVAVCHNTISLSRMTGEILFNERATKNFKTRLEGVKSEVEKAVGMAAVYRAAMDSVAQNQCSTDRAKSVFAGYITPPDEEKMSTRTSRTVDELTGLHRSGIGNKGETEFDLLNAYTEYLTHGSLLSKVPMGRRFASSEFGNGADDKADFAKMLTVDRSRLDSVTARGEKLLAVA